MHTRRTDYRTSFSPKGKVASADATKTNKEKGQTMTTTFDTTAKIRELTDAFRRHFPGTESATSQTDSLPPHGEHDFGSVTHDGQNLFWKIDTACEFGSEDPADPALTTHVLTIMLAENY
jgi:Protein of unknown function (DUF3768)